MSIDYRTLFRTAQAGDDDPTVLDDMIATRLLATRIPGLCPDCDQGDVKHLPYSQTCVHPNAPTIADLLRWGENVAKANQRPSVTRQWCKLIGHHWLYYGQGRGYCDRCGRFW